MAKLHPDSGKRRYRDLPLWVMSFMNAARVELWGVADLSDLVTPEDSSGQRFSRAISFAIPMDPEIMAGILTGPNERYANEYADVNSRINDLAERLSVELKSRGWRSMPLAASDRTDQENMRGDFPHKTAATRAGLGWVGRNCQLVTFKFGPWLRLGTVFTDVDLPCGPPIERNYCGKCNSCVEACPAGALTGTLWQPGIPREELLDVTGCDNWKKEHYYEFHRGHNCGICAAACPFGNKSLRRRKRTGSAPDS